MVTGAGTGGGGNASADTSINRQNIAVGRDIVTHLVRHSGVMPVPYDGHNFLNLLGIEFRGERDDAASARLLVYR